MISSIIHLVHRYDNDEQPWAIEIEDHQTGELHAEYLKEGEVIVLIVLIILPYSKPLSIVHFSAVILLLF